MGLVLYTFDTYYTYMVNKPCTYLIVGVSKKALGEVVETYADVILCDGANDNCPKKKIKCKITPHCWRIV